MNGFFVLEEQAKKLGLVDDPKYSSALQNVIITITEKDIQEYCKSNNINSTLTQENITEFQQWFYQNYYNSTMEIITNYGKYPACKK